MIDIIFPQTSFSIPEYAYCASKSYRLIWDLGSNSMVSGVTYHGESTIYTETPGYAKPSNNFHLPFQFWLPEAGEVTVTLPDIYSAKSYKSSTWNQPSPKSDKWIADNLTLQQKNGEYAIDNLIRKGRVEKPHFDIGYSGYGGVRLPGLSNSYYHWARNSPEASPPSYITPWDVPVWPFDTKSQMYGRTESAYIPNDAYDSDGTKVLDSYSYSRLTSWNLHILLNPSPPPQFVDNYPDHTLEIRERFVSQYSQGDIADFYTDSEWITIYTAPNNAAPFTNLFPFMSLDITSRNTVASRANARLEKRKRFERDYYQHTGSPRWFTIYDYEDWNMYTATMGEKTIPGQAGSIDPKLDIVGAYTDDMMVTIESYKSRESGSWDIRVRTGVGINTDSQNPFTLDRNTALEAVILGICEASIADGQSEYSSAHVRLYKKAIQE